MYILNIFQAKLNFGQWCLVQKYNVQELFHDKIIAQREKCDWL